MLCSARSLYYTHNQNIHTMFNMESSLFPYLRVHAVFGIKSTLKI